MVIGAYLGIYWMLISSVFVGYFSYYINSYYSKYLLNYSILDQIKDILPSFLTGFIGAILTIIPSVVYEYYNWGIERELASFIILPIQCVIGFITVYVILDEYKLDEYKEVKKNCLIIFF